jgi:tetratricopeptide (TPR) repeat protein
MNTTNQLDDAIREAVGVEKIVPDFARWQAEHPEAVRMLGASPNRPIWRRLVGHRMTKLAAAAAIAVAALYLLSSEFRFARTNTAWAVEQTVQALHEIKTLYIAGTIEDGSLFQFWLKRNADNNDLFKLRYESRDETVVVDDNTVYAYSPQRNHLEVLDKREINNCWNLKLWFMAMQLKLWMNGTILEQMKKQAADWTETRGRDEGSGRECVFVTCSYPPMSLSAWFQFDLESKLFVKGKLWMNPRREGPCLTADTFLYNQEIPDPQFVFVPPPGVSMPPKEKRALAQKAWSLFEARKHREALTAYQELYTKFPDGQTLGMIGICYDWLGEFDKEIETLEKRIRIHPDSKQELAVAYFYLGSACRSNRRFEKAVEAFTACLQTGQGICNPKSFPLKDAREALDYLQGRVKSGPLASKAWNLFHKEKKYAEALAVWQEIYRTYPPAERPTDTLMMIGICHEHLKQYDQAIEAFEKNLREGDPSTYPATYLYLGRTCEAAGRKEQAMEAYRNCIDKAPNSFNPEDFPMKDARERLAELTKGR